MLELKDISFEVLDENNNKKKEILHNINLEVEDQSFVVITGPNGSGKSTLAKIIMGMETPNEGSILLDGEEITDLDITERAKKGIGFAFQQPVRFKGLFVNDLLKLAAGKVISQEEAYSYLSEVGLSGQDYLEREINSSLSGGELKRIEIAMLLARETKLSIFDEPEAGIDLWSFKNLIRVFKKIRDKNKNSIIIISHQERILEIADKIIVMNDGNITQVGTKDEILPELLAKSSI